MRRAALLLTASCAPAAAWTAASWARPAVASVRAPGASACAADSTMGKEFFDSAKDEEEAEWMERAAAEAATARTAESLAEVRARGEAAAAALSSDAAATAALEARGTSKPSGKLAKALKKPSGTMTLVGEGVEMDSISLGGYDLNDPTYLSSQYRDGGCAATCVRVDLPGALDAAALAGTVAEQASAKGNFPSPLPVLSRAAFVDEIQLAAAAAAGVAGVVLPLNLNGAEKTRELAACAAELGLETIVRVCDAEELEAALAMEAPMVAVGDCSLTDLATLREQIPAGKAGPVAIADVPTLDVRGAWKVRDLKFNALICGRSMLELCVRDRVPPTAILKAYASKGSVKYGLGMQKGRLEGSKEYLGSLAM